MPDGVVMTGAPEIEPASEEVHDEVTDVLIVGAGPTGLALAAQLRAFGTRFRIIDRSLDRAHESRALAVQARSLEVLQSLGLGEELVKRGNASARLAIHFERRVAAEVQLGQFAATDTRFPFILFVSQAQTEAILDAHLTAAGVLIERGTELVDFSAQGDLMSCVLRDRDGREKRVSASYIVGCDGAHSTVRKRAGIAFRGDAYLQDFVLGDVEVDGPLKPDTLHSFSGGKGIAMFFPLRSPATWRVIALSAGTPGTPRHEEGISDEAMTTDLSLGELQSMVDGATGGGLRLCDPVWLTHFRLHHRQAERYRADRVFLAGDAAHIHSPVGAQGMNTGMQDAWNLGWKLALIARGAAHPRLLDSYEAERWPVGRFLLRYTDRLFSVFVRTMSTSPAAAWIRRHVAARVLPRVLSSRRLRTFAFHFVSELGIHYRDSFTVTEGTPKLTSGPRAGNRLPDAQLARNGERVYLQQSVGGPYLHLLLCGEAEGWDETRLAELAARYAPLLTVHFLTRHETPGALVDERGETLSRLGVRRAAEAAQYLVRPDGYVGFRCAGRDLLQLARYLATWFGAEGALRTGRASVH